MNFKLLLCYMSGEKNNSQKVIPILRAQSTKKYQYVNITRGIPTCHWFMPRQGKFQNLINVEFYCGVIDVRLGVKSRIY